MINKHVKNKHMSFIYGVNTAQKYNLPSLLAHNKSRYYIASQNHQGLFSAAEQSVT